MKITLPIPEFTRNERNLHCDVLHITTNRVARLVLDVAIKAYDLTWTGVAYHNRALVCLFKDPRNRQRRHIYIVYIWEESTGQPHLHVWNRQGVYYLILI